MERLMEDLDASRSSLDGNWPRTNLYDAGEHIVATMEVPGLNEEELKIEAHSDALTITGERKIQHPEGVTMHRAERSPGKFSRSFGLPCQVDLEKTTATLKNGVLTVNMRKHPEVQPKRITVA
jgi:HSP20 family protein